MSTIINRFGRFNLRSASLLLLLFIAITSFDTASPPSHRIIGIWEYEEKNLRMEMFEDHGSFSGRMIWFQCASEITMQNACDKENPDNKLVGRKLLGLTLLEKLSYQGNDVWSSGKIYDPNSGNTFEARIHLSSPNTAIVRGYWKFKWLGRSMVFNRL